MATGLGLVRPPSFMERVYKRTVTVFFHFFFNTHPLTLVFPGSSGYSRAWQVGVLPFCTPQTSWYLRNVSTLTFILIDWGLHATNVAIKTEADIFINGKRTWWQMEVRLRLGSRLFWWMTWWQSSGNWCKLFWFYRFLRVIFQSFFLSSVFFFYSYYEFYHRCVYARLRTCVRECVCSKNIEDLCIYTVCCCIYGYQWKELLG